MFKCLNVKMNKGFTFTELMVIIAVIAIFSVISFPHYKSIQKTMALERSAVRLAQDFRKVQEMAMSAYEFNGDFPIGGYGLYFDIDDPGHYIIFADLDGEQVYDEDENELVEDIYLEEGVELENCGILVSACEEFIAVYLPPDPEASFRLKPNGGCWINSSNAYIEISVNGSEKTINLNAVGLIDID